MTLATPKPLVEIEAKKPDYYLKDWLPIPKKSLTMISAPGGAGKSFMAIQAAIRMVNEKEDRRVLAWLSEDPAGLTKYRAETVLNRVLTHEAGHLRGIDVIDEMPPHLDLATYEGVKSLFLPYNLVILDPLIAFFGGEENSNSHARFFMNLLNRIARENSQSIIIIHHTTKGSKEQEARSRGAGAFVDAVRLAYDLKVPEGGGNEREIVVAKDNFGVRQIIGESKTVRVLPYEVVVEKAAAPAPRQPKSTLDLLL